MAIGLTYHPGLTATHPRRTTVGLRSHLTARVVRAVMAGVDLVALMGVAVLLAPGHGLSFVWGFPFVAVALMAAYGHYDVRVAPSLLREARSLMACAIAPLVVLAFARVATPSGLIEAVLVTAVAVLVIHSASYKAVKAMRSRGLLSERTLIVGAGQVGVELASTLKEHPEYGLRPVGFVDDVGSEHLPLPIFGGVDLLRLVLFEEHIDRVIVAFGVAREANMVQTIRACEDAMVEIHVLPRFFELGVATDGRDVDEVWGVPLVHLRRSPLRRWTWAVKRVFDVSLAALALLALSPLYGALALAVKLTSPGPVYFRQKRVGQHGNFVEVLKFRTMRVHEGTDEEWTADDDRVTVVGKLTRRLGLDELPQLWSVIRGDMSLVGPRPERPFFVERFKGEVRHYDARHRVPVGLTGLAQVNGLRGDTSIGERARFDNRYIESWSLWRDLVILVQTLSAVIRDALSPSSTGVAPAPTSRAGGSSLAEVSDVEAIPISFRPLPLGSSGDDGRYRQEPEWDQVVAG